jgi:Asp-tRNA(Asn)/Glu-tRNA(Gln) amidotransferase A subunit family amidase
VQLSSYEDLRARLLSHAITCEEVVRFYLERIESHRGDNIYITVFHEQAMERARSLDRKLSDGGRPGKLFGMPINLYNNNIYKQKSSIITMGEEDLFCASIEDTSSIKTLHCFSLSH